MVHRHKICLTPKDLASGDSHLSNLLAYAKSLVDVDGPQAARNAGLLYLALIMAFQENGSIEMEWVPKLLLEFGNEDYEIYLADTTSSVMVDKVYLAVDKSSPESINGKAAPKGRNAHWLLRELAARPVIPTGTPVVEEMSAAPESSADVDMQSVNRRNDHLESSSVSRLDPSEQIEIVLNEVYTLELKASGLSIATNQAYWNLGRAYFRFCQLHGNGKPWYDRTEQHRLFQLLCSSPRFSASAKERKARLALQKRLLRARKFVHLVETLGANVLRAVPTVCVTNLDRMPLEQLRLLASSMGEKNLLNAARANL
ncbi:hypothetical protein I204_08533 [Kwoniella mangroviensis CBS 8886]|nr:hypothetical protein I204_08533 [Kwoniella mangroviensis CBS 8886]